MDNSSEGHPNKQRGWEHICTVLVLVAEYLSVRYSITWLAWSAAIFLWLAVGNYARHYLSARRAKIAILAAIPIIVAGTYCLTREAKKPEVVAQGQAVPTQVAPPASMPPVQPQQLKSRSADKKKQPTSKSKPIASQDNSVHVDHGSKIELQSSGDCSPNIVGGSNTVTCGPPPAKITHWEQKAAHWQEGSTLVDEAQVTITADHSIEIPAFWIKCDRPCHGERRGSVWGLQQGGLPKHR